MMNRTLPGFIRTAVRTAVPVFALSLLFGAATAAESVAMPPAAAAPAPAPVVNANGALDIARYTGVWFEIARQPHYFQRNCARNVTAAYALEEDHLRVVNRCEKEGGEVISVEGKAYVTDAPMNRKLEVGFFEIFGWMPFTGDYWVLDFDPEYRWAIIGGADKELGWVLSRTPRITPALRAELDARLRLLGYDPRAFLSTPQPERR